MKSQIKYKTEIEEMAQRIIKITQLINAGDITAAYNCLQGMIGVAEHLSNQLSYTMPSKSGKCDGWGGPMPFGE